MADYPNVRGDCVPLGHQSPPCVEPQCTKTPPHLRRVPVSRAAHPTAIGTRWGLRRHGFQQIQLLAVHSCLASPALEHETHGYQLASSSESRDLATHF